MYSNTDLIIHCIVFYGSITLPQIPGRTVCRIRIPDPLTIGCEQPGQQAPVFERLEAGNVELQESGSIFHIETFSQLGFEFGEWLRQTIPS